MKLAFYIYQKGKLFDYFIALVTLSKYSHVELLLDDGVTSISSSSRDGGVRKKVIDYDQNRWVFVDIKEFNISEEYILSRFEIYKKYKYDWVSIFLHKFKIRSYERFICSDFINFLLTGELKFISPGGLFDFIIRYKLKEKKL